MESTTQLTVDGNFSDNTTAVTRISGPIIYSVQHLVITSVVLGLMILCTIIGNLFVIAAIILEKNLHSVANYLILSLAVADLMVASIVMPISVVGEVGSIIISGYMTTITSILPQVYNWDTLHNYILIYSCNMVHISLMTTVFYITTERYLITTHDYRRLHNYNTIYDYNRLYTDTEWVQRVT